MQNVLMKGTENREKREDWVRKSLAVTTIKYNTIKQFKCTKGPHTCADIISHGDGMARLKTNEAVTDVVTDVVTVVVMVM
eukprot:6092883-Ditylum_brightwellii.AAC.1